MQKFKDVLIMCRLNSHMRKEYSDRYVSHPVYCLICELHAQYAWSLFESCFTASYLN